MRTITFYAYKGGTGRTLALTKAADFLADDGDGKRVFVLDLDLEAPGLHFKLLDSVQRANLCPGFIELAHAFVFDGCLPTIEGHAVGITRPHKKGEVLLMPAGQALSGEYWKKLTHLHWQELFGKDLGDGVPLFLELKDRIHETFKPDYLLVDSRTGITEIGGAALTLLPDDVVCLFSHNDESLWGTREAIRAISKTPRLLSQKPVRVVPVLARFPKDEAEEANVLTNALVYLNEPALGGVSPNFTKIYLLHSHRSLEVNERSEVAQEEGKGGSLRTDYDMLFKDGLSIELPSLSLGHSLEQAERATNVDTAMARWREVLDKLFGQPVHDPDAILEAIRQLEDASSRIGKHEGAFRAVAKHEDALPYFRRAMEMEIAPFLRTAAAQYLALSLAKLGRFEEISSEILAVALEATTNVDRTSGRDDDSEVLRRLSQLKDEYDRATERYWSYEVVVRGVARGLERSGNGIEAKKALGSGIAYFQRWGDEGVLPLAAIRRELGNLLKRLGDPIAAEAELREADLQFRRGGAKESILQSTREELASVMDAQYRPDAAQAIRDASERARRHAQRDAISQARTAPRLANLPAKATRTARAGVATESFEIPLRIVTPLLGGAAETREIDAIDVVRVPSVRGHLRFWWRALHTGGLSGKELYALERRLWGGAGDEAGGRSTVEIRITVQSMGEVDISNVMPYGRDETRGAYALWPARATTRGPNPQPVAHRRLPGTRFSLHVTCQASDETQVRNAIRAWILFGGYGGRTRRGAGSLTVEGADRSRWLLGDERRSSIRDLFGQDVLQPIADRELDDVPLLAGAWLRVGAPTSNAMGAWTTALHWLRDFRQAPPGSGPLGLHDSEYARDRGDSRPGRSNWPEADKVRHLSGINTPWAHTPRHNHVPVWPRAGFGLPIVAQFQRSDRKTRQAYPYPGEPRDFELRWREAGTRAGGKAAKVHDRLASPLIVKALPLSNGDFVPCALWLFRGYPAGGQVILEPKDVRSAGSAADFDVLVSPGDRACYGPLSRAQSGQVGTRLRTAFFDWLAARYKSSVRTVAP